MSVLTRYNSAIDLIEKLADVMRRCDEGWCVLYGHPMTSDEEWDTALGEAEDWLEDNP